MSLLGIAFFTFNRHSTPISIQTAPLPTPVPQTSTDSQVQAGHLAYKLLKTSLDQYSVGSDGKPLKFALECSIRITELMDYSEGIITDEMIRLLVDGQNCALISTLIKG